MTLLMNLRKEREERNEEVKVKREELERLNKGLQNMENNKQKLEQHVSGYSLDDLNCN